ncbi:MAG: hypothetical protein ACTHN5_14885 [Phycisphaerae bacterium]
MSISHPSIIIASRAEADSWSQHEMLPIRAIISITGAEDRPCAGFDRVEQRIRLEFEDVVAERARSSSNVGPRAPRREHAAAIIDFARKVQSVDGILLVHCTGGRSRSPAAAVLCLAAWLGPGEEEGAAREVFRMRPGCSPHRELVRFGDEVLGLRGNLIAAVDRAQPAME